MSQKTCLFFAKKNVLLSGIKANADMKKVLLISTSVLLSLLAKSQVDTLLHKSFDEITISASRQQIYTSGNRKDFADSLILSSFKNFQLSQILNFTGSLAVRSYGPGNLATATLRGGNSYQTSVSWDGFTINNPVNGMCDFNLIPSFLFENISIYPGIPSSIQGSGSISGGINISGDGVKKNETEFLQTYGSFSTINTGLKNTISSKNVSNSIKTFYSKSANDYPFKNIAEEGSPRQKLSNSLTLLFSIIDEISLTTKKSGNFKIAYWFTSAQRQIPPTMLMPLSKAFQNDVSHKTSLKWSKNIKKLNIRVNSIYQNDYLKYNDIDQNINSITHNETYINDAILSYKLNKNSISGIGFTSSSSTATVENITTTDTSLYNKSTRNQISLWASQFYKIEKLKTEFSLSFRQDVVENSFLPFIPSFGYKTFLNKNFSIFGQMGKVYRIPTLNDLYWNPGGNPNLKPESGFQFEQSLAFENIRKKLELSSTITGFSRVVNNWIQWQPVSSAIWSPMNIGKVYSRGVEFRNSLKIKIKNKTYCKTGLNLNLTKSENIYKNDKNEGKQLIYVPYFNSSVFTAFVISKTSLIIQATSIGERFTSNDNTENIEGFTIVNFSAKQTFESKKTTFDLFLRINNLIDKNYEEMAWRPMPGRNYETGICINFKHKK